MRSALLCSTVFLALYAASNATLIGRIPSTLVSIVAVFSALSTVSAFSFTYGAPTQCDDMPISWSGGTAPFQLLLIPVFGTPRNITIPASAFSNGQGKFSFSVPIEKDKRFMLTMSDSTGFATGGTTPLLVTGASQGGSCNVTDPGVAFSYQLNTALQQCRPYLFEGYDGAIQPVVITAIVPGGQHITLNPPNGPTNYTWTADVSAGTALIFIMVDSLGRQGGSSSTLDVGPSDDSSCLTSNSPSSTASTTPPTTPTTTATMSSSPTSSPSSKTSVGAVLGTILGALIFLAVFITLGLFILRRRRERNIPWNPPQRMPSQTNLTDGAPVSPYHYTGSSPSVSHPFLSPSDNPFNPPYSASSSSLFPQQDPFNPRDSVAESSSELTLPSSQSSAAQRKAAMAGYSPYKPQRFVVHTDIEDAVPPPTDDEVIELPPQYSARSTVPPRQDNLS